jgi:hypothetical protein
LHVVDGFVRVSTNVRTLATTVWVALIAASIQTHDSSLAIVAACALPIFALLDGYHGWLYTQASERAYKMEGLLRDYYKLIQRNEEEIEVNKMLSHLREHKYGQLRNFKTRSATFYFRAKPYAVYWFFYPALIIGALILAAVIGCDPNFVAPTIVSTGLA